MTNRSASTYYLLRSKQTSVGDGPYVGLAADGVHLLVPARLQARRFASLADAEHHAGKLGEKSGEFEVEIGTSQ